MHLGDAELSHSFKILALPGTMDGRKPSSEAAYRAAVETPLLRFFNHAAVLCALGKAINQRSA